MLWTGIYSDQSEEKSISLKISLCRLMKCCGPQVQFAQTRCAKYSLLFNKWRQSDVDTRLGRVQDQGDAIDKDWGHFLLLQGTLANSDYFAKDFSCPSGSPMNPENKCQVLWFLYLEIFGKIPAMFQNFFSRYGERGDWCQSKSSKSFRSGKVKLAIQKIESRNIKGMAMT